MNGTFVNGPARIVVCDDSQKIEAIDDIIVLNGLDQYDVRPGFDDFGVSRTGILVERDEADEYDLTGNRSVVSTTMKVTTQIDSNVFESLQPFAALRPQTIADNWHGHHEVGVPARYITRTVIFMMQKVDKSIYAWVFESCRLLPIELGLDFNMRATAIPIGFIFSSGYMITRMERKKPTNNVITFTDFDAWRKTIESP